MLLATGGLSSFGMAQALDPSVQLLLLQQQVQFHVKAMSAWDEGRGHSVCRGWMLRKLKIDDI